MAKFEFCTLLTDAERAELAAEKLELERLHGLSDPWLAAELLRLGRKARLAAPDKLGQPESGYENGLVWNVIPDLACRLSPMLRSRLTTSERLDPDLISRTGEAYRDWVAVYLRQSAMYSWGHRAECQDKRTLRLLGNVPVNGNPVAIALDRIYPAEQYEDALAKEMRLISDRRGHRPVMSSWSPAFSISYPYRDSVPSAPKFINAEEAYFHHENDFSIQTIHPTL